MALTARRQFIQQSSFAAVALYGCPAQLLAGVRGILTSSEQNVASVDPAEIRTLASKITGQLITPAAPDYESSRLVFNRAFDRHPALIVRCASDSDVSRALDFAQSQNLPLAVRSGGHSRLGYGMCDGGGVIDLSGMSESKLTQANAWPVPRPVRSCAIWTKPHSGLGLRQRQAGARRWGSRA
jgi:hypothetical protein